MTFNLTNAPAGRARKPIAAPRSGVQLALLSGLDCLPGQQDLFDVDGADKLPRDRFTLGQPVKNYTIPTGWRFGRIIGLHIDNVGLNTTGLAMATVRFLARGKEPEYDEHLPQFCLEAYPGEPTA